MKKSIKAAGGQAPDKEYQNQIEDLTNRWKRALADYQNLEKRYQRERQDFIQFANANLILKLVGILNHLQKASLVLKEEGVDLIVNEFKKVLQEEGLEEIECLGKKFNPEHMEAVEIVTGGEENTVAEVVSKGFWLKDKLLIPAKVKVYKN